MLKLFYKYGLLFQIGGCAYYYTEVLLRGWSHWSMFLLGALCFLFCSLQKKVSWWKQTLPRQLVRCLLFVLAGEFITGCMVNLWMGWDVWNYSDVPLNILGQVCVPMEFAFAILCYLGLWIDEWVRVYAFGEERIRRGIMTNEEDI